MKSVSICTKCGKTCSYVKTYRGNYWVHDDTSRFISNEPERHDCNTFIKRGATA